MWEDGIARGIEDTLCRAIVDKDSVLQGGQTTVGHPPPQHRNVHLEFFHEDL